MHIKKRYIIIALVLYIGVWAGNIIYYEAHRLNGPLFMKHYYNFMGQNSFFIYYARNKGESSKIGSVSFPELPDLPIRWSEREGYASSNYYTLSAIDISFDQQLMEKVLNGRQVLLTKASIFFNNGKQMDVDIGEIYLSPMQTGEKALHMTQSHGSNNNSGGAMYTVEAPVTIKGVDDRLLRKFPDIAEIEINGKPLKDISFPVKLNKGETVNLNYIFSFKDKDDMRRYNYYALNPYIIYETEDGKEWRGFFDVHYDASFRYNNFKELEGGIH